ncbi:TnsD family Tn7-like transposition protein [Brassicibacter mesophilus]|uniref:TnsD family Tn7-like transposition protein n=1 Tax=Brassicibacter mesophilus TaxID=745119 RepID=UPI003D2208A3
MISIFPSPYPDEIINNIFYRYHIISGNTSIEQSLNDLFARLSYTHLSDFPANTGNLCLQLNELYTPEEFIYNYTPFPIFTVFLSEKKVSSYISQTKSNKACSLKMKLYDESKLVTKRKYIKICRKCMEADRKEYGEAYPHRIHQIEGNYICHIHNEILEYYIKPKNKSKWAFIDINDVDLIKESIDITGIEKEIRNISNDILFIIKNYRSFPSIDDILKKYKIALYKAGYISYSGKINQMKLSADFLQYYSKKFLDLLYSNIEIEDKRNWIRKITGSSISKYKVHPIRHILLVRFLFGKANKLLSYNEKIHTFGEGPWPCLNPSAYHYKEKVIYDFKLSKYGELTNPIEVFTCNCGYVYSSKEIDKENLPIKNRTLQYGYVWELALKEYLITRNYSITEIAQMMGCQNPTIKKIACKLGLDIYLDNQVNIEKYKNSSIENRNKNIELEKEYIKTITEYIKMTPNVTRNEIHNKFRSEYIWLSKNHRDSLEKILPNPVPRKKNKCIIDWEKRDRDFYINVKKAIEDIKHETKPRKITITAIGREVGYEKLNRIVDSLPETKKLLQDELETTEQFAKRKIDFIAKKIKEKNKNLTKMKILEGTGIRSPLSNEIEDYIINVLDNQ